jgi:membrane protease YdiL (CAAX protease family)
LVIEAVLGPLLASGLPLAGGGALASDVWTTCLSLLVGTGLTLYWIGREPWSEVWLDRDAARPRLIGLGFAIGALAIGVPTATLIGVHWFAAVPGDRTSWLGGAWRVTMSLAPAALAEELLARGYIMSVLVKWWGWPWAIATTSIAFGALHIRNPGATPESIALVTIAGVFLASVVYGTRSLYAAWAAHFAWNWTMAVAFHVAVSGLPLESPGYRYVDAGPNWATGGTWGPEAGLPAALTMIAGSVWLFSRRGRKGLLGRSTGET